MKNERRSSQCPLNNHHQRYWLCMLAAHYIHRWYHCIIINRYINTLSWPDGGSLSHNLRDHV